MKYIKIIFFDIKNGIIKNKFFIISSFILSISFCLNFFSNIKGYSISHNEASHSISDILLFIYGGMKEYIPKPDEPFQIPILWILLFTSIFFGSLNYPYNDLHNYGKQILIRTKGRTLWWISKCVWNITYNILFHLILILSILVFSLISNANINTTINTDLAIYNFSLKETDLISKSIAIPFYFFITPILMSIAISLLQMTLSLFIKPIFSFLFISIILISSTYIIKPYLIANYSMMIRNDMILTNGVNFNIGIIVSIILSSLFILVGAIRFYFYDIVNTN